MKYKTFKKQVKSIRSELTELDSEIGLMKSSVYKQAGMDTLDPLIGYHYDFDEKEHNDKLTDIEFYKQDRKEAIMGRLDSVVENYVSTEMEKNTIHPDFVSEFEAAEDALHFMTDYRNKVLDIDQKSSKIVKHSLYIKRIIKYHVDELKDIRPTIDSLAEDFSKFSELNSLQTRARVPGTENVSEAYDEFIKKMDGYDNCNIFKWLWKTKCKDGIEESRNFIKTLKNSSIWAVDEMAEHVEHLRYRLKKVEEPLRIKIFEECGINEIYGEIALK